VAIQKGYGRDAADINQATGRLPSSWAQYRCGKLHQSREAILLLLDCRAAERSYSPADEFQEA